MSILNTYAKLNRKTKKGHLKPSSVHKVGHYVICFLRFWWCHLKIGPAFFLQSLKKKKSRETAAATAVAAAAKSLQPCPTLCNPIDGSPPGFPVPGILQARTMEWVAISFSNAWKWEVKMKSLSRVRPSATPWTAAYQAPPSMGFSRQEYWSGVPLPSPAVKLGINKH